MPTVRGTDENTDIYLISVDQFSVAADAAEALWKSVFEAAKVHGGRPILKKPEDGEWGYVVTWDGGPPQWANAYVADPESDAPGFSSMAEGDAVRFVDLD